MASKGGWSLDPQNRKLLLGHVSKAASFMGRVEARQTRVETRFSSSQTVAPTVALGLCLRCLRRVVRHRLNSSVLSHPALLQFVAIKG